ncbi:MAG: GNAT family N-acetyltransferase [Gammaproteobacteria bacterium]|nr:MAG: GNAT family N-acetyltransferase [Gammaproteobacteria bacterium]
MILLKPFEITDLPQLNQWIRDEKELFQFAGDYFTFPIDTKQITRYLHDKNRCAFQVRYQGNPIGHAEIYKEGPKRARLCRMLLCDTARGKGLGKATIKTLLYKCFNELSIESVHLHVFDWNLTAIKCYESCGFQITPNQITKIHYRDKIWQAINMTTTNMQWTQDN